MLSVLYFAYNALSVAGRAQTNPPYLTQREICVAVGYRFACPGHEVACVLDECSEGVLARYHAAAAFVAAPSIVEAASQIGKPSKAKQSKAKPAAVANRLNRREKLQHRSGNPQ
jgi:hypothetical protein